MKDKYDNATAELDLVDNFHIPVLLTWVEYNALITFALLLTKENPNLRWGQALCNAYPFQGLRFPELYYCTDEEESIKLASKLTKEDS